MNRRIWGALLAGLVVCLPAVSAFAAVIDLGDAATFSVLGIPNGSNDPDVRLFSSAVITGGSVGVGVDGSYTAGAGSEVTGTSFLAPGVTANIAGSANLGPVVLNSDLSQAIADALQASLDADALAATQTFGIINNDATWFGNGGVNVIDITSIDLSGNDILTLSGGAADLFIINVSDDFDMGGISKIVTAGGLVPGHVLFNFPTAGSEIRMTASARAQGTLLAPFRDAHLDGDLNTGAIIANDIRFGSSGQLLFAQFGTPADPEEPPQSTPVVPEPASCLLFGLGLLGAGRVARRRSAR